MGHYTFSCRYSESSRVNTYAWIIATAISRSINRARMDRVSPASSVEVVTRLSAAVEIRCIRRCPAVRLAVSRTASAIGRMSRLIVSIKIKIGIRGVGVPSGRRWASEEAGLFRRPISTVASHSGRARAMFIDS